MRFHGSLIPLQYICRLWDALDMAMQDVRIEHRLVGCNGAPVPQGAVLIRRPACSTTSKVTPGLGNVETCPLSACVNLHLREERQSCLAWCLADYETEHIGWLFCLAPHLLCVWFLGCLSMAPGVPKTIERSRRG